MLAPTWLSVNGQLLLACSRMLCWPTGGSGVAPSYQIPDTGYHHLVAVNAIRLYGVTSYPYLLICSSSSVPLHPFLFIGFNSSFHLLPFLFFQSSSHVPLYSFLFSTFIHSFLALPLLLFFLIRSSSSIPLHPFPFIRSPSSTTLHIFLFICSLSSTLFIWPCFLSTPFSHVPIHLFLFILFKIWIGHVVPEGGFLLKLITRNSKSEKYHMLIRLCKRLVVWHFLHVLCLINCSKWQMS